MFSTQSLYKQKFVLYKLLECLFWSWHYLTQSTGSFVLASYARRCHWVHCGQASVVSLTEKTVSQCSVMWWPESNVVHYSGQCQPWPGEQTGEELRQQTETRGQLFLTGNFSNKEYLLLRRRQNKSIFQKLLENTLKDKVLVRHLINSRNSF